MPRSLFYQNGPVLRLQVSDRPIVEIVEPGGDHAPVTGCGRAFDAEEADVAVRNRILGKECIEIEPVENTVVIRLPEVWRQRVAITHLAAMLGVMPDLLPDHLRWWRELDHMDVPDTGSGEMVLQTLTVREGVLRSSDGAPTADINQDINTVLFEGIVECQFVESVHTNCEDMHVGLPLLS